MNMTRREAVIKMATLMGATLVGPRLLAANFGTAAGAADATPVFSSAEIALLDEIGDTIIPATDVPGAKATGIGAFIAMMVRDCYEPRDQAAVKEGLEKVGHAYSMRFGETFIAGKSVDRTAFLNELDREQKLYTDTERNRTKAGRSATEREPGPHYFRIVKELTVLGYFTSEIGCTQGVRFMEVPGRFDGNAPYKHGEHAWFS